MFLTASKRATILLIEDDTVLADAFAAVLRSAGHAVWRTTATDEGLEKAQIVRPATIIVEFRMPPVSGLDFLYRLRAGEPNRRTPLMVVTGDTSLDDDVKAQLHDLGAALRFKPIMPNELLEAVQGLLDQSTTGSP